MLKSYRELLKQEIERCGMDGLWCSEGPCGCLKDDLMPCDRMWEDVWEGCKTGKRMDYAANEDCGCDCPGVDHWHICDPT